METVSVKGTITTKRPASEISEVTRGPLDEIGSFAT